MISLSIDGSFASWRDSARRALLAGLAPEQVQWNDETAEPDLFSQASTGAPKPSGKLRVSAELLTVLESAAQYRTPARWSLLYRVLWRFVQGDRSATLAGDIDGSQLQQRIKAVRREAHHLHAFLRFTPCTAQGAPEFVAWFEPAHDILLSACEHFCQRLGQHSWLIATPCDGVWFDGQQLHYQPICPEQWQRWAQQQDNNGQALWRAYYSSTFNPARLNQGALSQHMPLRFWKNLPEGPLIPQLMSEARAGAQRDGQALLLAGRKGKRIERSPQTPISVSSDPDHHR